MTTPKQPKVFISYSWTSEPHKEWVLSLAERLSGDGVEVILDRWDLKPGHDINVFMEQMVTDPTVSKVLVICDKAYAEKADKRKGGVGTETHIISAEVYQKVRQEKFIPIIRERDAEGHPCRPTYMKSAMYFDFTDEDGFSEAYDSLLRNLHNAPELVKPPVGKAPAHIFNQTAVIVSTAGKFQRLREVVEKDRPHKEAILREYLESLGNALEEFRITARDVNTEPDETVMERVAQMRPYRNEFIEFCLLYATRLDTEEGYAAVHDFLERLLRLHYSPEGSGGWSEWYSDPFRFLSYEWVLYLISALIHSRKYKTAARFMDDTYQIRHPHHAQLRSEGIGGFNSFVRSIDEYRKNRLNLRLYSVVAEIIKESATHSRITFHDLFQTDLLLMLQPVIVNSKAMLSWYPRLSGYSESGGGVELFARATTEKGVIAVLRANALNCLRFPDVHSYTVWPEHRSTAPRF